MPVFINEVVVRGEIKGEGAAPAKPSPSPGPDDPAARAGLISEITEAVIEQLERQLDRMEER